MGAEKYSLTHSSSLRPLRLCVSLLEARQHNAKLSPLITRFRFAGKHLADDSQLQALIMNSQRADYADYLSRMNSPAGIA